MWCVSIYPQCCVSVGQMSRAQRQIALLKQGGQKVIWGTQSCSERDSAELWHCRCLDVLLCSLIYRAHVCSQNGGVIFSNWVTVSVCKWIRWSYVCSALFDYLRNLSCTRIFLTGAIMLWIYAFIRLIFDIVILLQNIWEKISLLY